MSGREERDERRRSRSRSRSRSPRRRRTEGREREEHTGACAGSQKLRERNPKAERAVAGAWDDGRGRGGGGRRGRNELLSFKAFTNGLPDHVTPAEAEAKYAQYKAKEGGQFRRDEFQSRKEEAWMRQQFDPRQLEELVRLRSEAAAQAAASFDVPSEMQLASAATHDNGAAGEEVMADAEGAAAKQRRMAHDAAQAHALIRALDAEKGISATPLQQAVDDCAATWETEEGLARRTCAACVSYLWRVHGLDYFAGTELSPADHKRRLARSPMPPPADAPAGAPWEATVDGAWKQRLAAGDPVQASLGVGRAEAAVRAFVDGSVKQIDATKFQCGVVGCGKMFMGEDFVRKHLATKHAQALEEARSKALDEVYLENYTRFATAVDAAGGRGGRAEGERGGEGRGRGWKAPPGGQGEARPPRRYRESGPPFHHSPPLPPHGFGRGNGFGGGLPLPGFGPVVVPYVDLDGPVVLAAAAAAAARPVLDYGDL